MLKTAWYNDFAEWLLGLVEWVFDRVAQLWAYVVETMLTPLYESTYFGAWQTYIAAAWSGPVVFWLDLVHADFGLSMMLGAYTVRFAIRRLPWIG